MACECANNLDSVKTSFERADLVLKGHVISKLIVEKRDTVYKINENGDTTSTQIIMDPNAYLNFTMLVDEYYKGGIQNDTVEVRGPVYSFCMANLDDDGTYFVFANLTQENVYHTHYCSGNKSFNPHDQRVLDRIKNKKPTHKK